MINELITKKKELLDAAKAISERTFTANDGKWQGDDEKRFDELTDQADKIQADIERLARLDSAERKLVDMGQSQGRRSEPNQTSGQTRQAAFRQPSQQEMAESLRAWLLPSRARTDNMRAIAARTGVQIDAPEFTFSLAPVALRSNTPEGIAEWKRANEEHRAAMGTTSGAVGQYSVPDATMQALERAMLAFGGMRQVATIIRTDTGAALPFPTTDDTSNKGAILTENTQVSEVDPTFGQLTLDAYMYSSKSVLVSLQLLQDSSVDIPSMIGSMLGERIGRIQNDHFTTGTGSSQPNGIVTAATSSAITLSGTATATYDNVVDLIHSIDPAYRERSKFMFHDGALKMLKKIKVLQYSGDTAGVPLWQPSLVAGQPDLIHGYPYVINQSMTTPATAVKSLIFGALDKYLIRDVREITLVRLNERYADYHQVGFLAFARSDGDLLDAGTHPVKYATQA